MPDWKSEIRWRLANLKIEPAREASIIEELSQYLEDCYAEFLASGAKLNIIRVARVAKLLILLMGMVGIEPTRPFGHRFLRPARLPVPPRPHVC